MGTTVLSSIETANRLGIRPQTLRLWRLLGIGPRFVRYGRLRGRVVYRPEDIEEFLESRTFTSTSDETVRQGQDRQPQ
jgi:DNA-binding transcriptional MerR regulator